MAQIMACWPVQCWAFIWTNAALFSIWSLESNFNEILIKIPKFLFKKIHFKMLSVKLLPFCPGGDDLTQWGRVTHICVSKSTIFGSDNGLSLGRYQAIILTNAGLLSIGTLGTNFSEILSEIHTFLFRKRHLKMPSGNGGPFCLSLSVLHYPRIKTWITNHDFQMQLLIGCQQSCQPIRSHMRKSRLVYNHNFIPG